MEKIKGLIGTKLKDGATVVEVRYRYEVPVALLKYDDKNFCIAYNFWIKNNKLDAAQQSFYMNPKKAMQDFNMLTNYRKPNKKYKAVVER